MKIYTTRWRIVEFIRNFTEQKVMLMIAPDHARVISGGGWTKDDIRMFMYRHSRRSWREIKHLIQPDLLHPAHRWLVNTPDDTMLPIVKDPSYFDVVVVGGTPASQRFACRLAARRLRR